MRQPEIVIILIIGTFVGSFFGTWIKEFKSPVVENISEPDNYVDFMQKNTINIQYVR